MDELYTEQTRILEEQIVLMQSSVDKVHAMKEKCLDLELSLATSLNPTLMEQSRRAEMVVKEIKSQIDALGALGNPAPIIKIERDDADEPETSNNASE